MLTTDLKFIIKLHSLKHKKKNILGADHGIAYEAIVEAYEKV